MLYLGCSRCLAIVWLLLVFPSGNFESRWERIVAIGLLIMGVAITFGFAVDPMPMEETGQVSPLAIPALGDAVGCAHQRGLVLGCSSLSLLPH